MFSLLTGDKNREIPPFQERIPELGFLSNIHVGSFETFVSPTQRFLL